MLKPLRDIRSFRVQVVHPKDRECDELVAQIQRIGCRVGSTWPPEGDISTHIDIAFVLFRQDEITSSVARALSERRPSLTVIGIVEFESPAVIEAIVKAGTSAIVTKPIRAFGLLTEMIIAHTLNQRAALSAERVAKLESKLSGLKQFEKAKSILMARKNLSEQEAYETIRLRAMSKRVTMEAVCAAIVEANDILE